MSQVCDRHGIAISAVIISIVIADEECGCGIHRGKAVGHVSDADVWVSDAEPNYRSNYCMYNTIVQYLLVGFVWIGECLHVYLHWAASLTQEATSAGGLLYELM